MAPFHGGGGRNSSTSIVTALISKKETHKDINKIWVKLNISMHHEDHDMSSASLYHTRRCMLGSIHRKLPFE